MVVNIGSLAIMAATIRAMEKAGDDWKGDMDIPETSIQDIAARRRAQANVSTCNLSEEEQAERDRPKSRQERRQLERLRRKGRI